MSTDDCGSAVDRHGVTEAIARSTVRRLEILSFHPLAVGAPDVDVGRSVIVVVAVSPGADDRGVSLERHRPAEVVADGRVRRNDLLGFSKDRSDLRQSVGAE